MSAPLISVIMSVRNGLPYLGEAMASIFEQTLGDFEFIVIDDCSTDETARLLAGYNDSRLRVITNRENLGLTRNLNRGIAMAQGRYVARMDADDRAHPKRFDRQVEFLDRYHEIAVLGTQCRLIDAAGRSKGVLSPKPLTPFGVRWQSIIESPFVHSSVMMRTDVVRQLGGYDERLRTSQDFELWSRLLRNHDGANLPDVLLDFRSHDSSVSSSYKPEQIQQAYEAMGANISHYGGGEYENWLRDWIRITNPSLWKTSRCQNPKRLLMSLRNFKLSFLERVPSKLDASEIADQYRHTIWLMTTNLAISGDIRFFQLWAEVFWQQPLLASVGLPGLIARWLRHLLTRRSR